MKPIVAVKSLKVIKGGRAICHIPELTVAPGERVGLIGANGSGKSTLLRVLGALESDFTGECRIAAGRRDRLYVHQSPCLFRGSVLFNTAYGLAARGVSRSDRRRMAGRWLKRLGVEHLARRRCTRLSGGERRRVALARAFALEPQLLLLDEPFAELDEQGISIVRGAMNELTRTTLLIASPAALPEQVVQRVVEVEAII